MKWKVIVTGKPSLAYAREGVEEYLKRLQRYVSVEMVYLRPSSSAAETEERYREVAAGSFTIALDERGENWCTSQFREAVDGMEMDGTQKSVAVLIGGADGHGESLRKAADKVICLGKMTMQHELALVVFLEQLYRVYTIKRGEPYHR